MTIKKILEQAANKIKDEYGLVIQDVSFQWIATGTPHNPDYTLVGVDTEGKLISPCVNTSRENGL